MIPLARPLIEDDDIQAVIEVLSSGQLVQGARVAQFESEVASLVGSAHAVAVSNCTAALHLSLLALGVGAGDKVAVTTYSWIATANVIELVGATPVFVDIDPVTFNMDPASLRAVLAREPGIRAVVPVDTFGNCRGIDVLAAIAGDAGVPLVEDAACALGARSGDRAAGAWGTLGCFSFHPRKAITTGEGGIIVTDDARHASLLRSLRNHGLDPSAPSPDFVMAGYNLRMTEFQAALGSSQLTKISRIIATRRAVATAYGTELASLGCSLPTAGPEHILQSYVVLLPTRLRGKVQDIVAAMRGRGIESTIGTWHMPLTTHFRTRYGYRPGDFPGTDEVFDRAMSLPLHHELSDDDIATITTTFAEVVGSA